MVARSPFSACVINSASGAGSRRSGATALVTSKVSPSTKRAASTWPWRCLAARSPLAGIRRGSAIAFAQELVDCARGLAFAALWPRRLGRRRPGVDIEVQPAPRVLDKALQEQRAGDRAGKGARRRIGDAGDLGVEPAV